jgi:uncharacterized membrane protein
MIDSVLQWMQGTAPAVAIAESTWLFPTIETVHVLALTTVVGSIAMIDLRLIGAAQRHRSVIELTREVLPWTWIAFVIAVCSGSLMFASNAVKYFANLPIRIKMILLVSAGINMLYFHLVTYRSAHTWHMDAKIPRSGRISGAVSLALWISIVGFGRWIGFV